MLKLATDNSTHLWKKIGNVGAGKERKKAMPDTVKTASGEMVTDKDTVINTWKDYFETLLNPSLLHGNETRDIYGPHMHVNNMNPGNLDSPITRDEVCQALSCINKGKAMGADEIQVEALTNNYCIDFMTTFFNKCFEEMNIPELWKKGTITPILKCKEKDAKDPNNYRGITVTCAMYKVYCKILLQRLEKWCETNEILEDEQNGFRKGRSCTDQLITLVGTIQSRMHYRQDTYVAFIDFSKAYDSVSRTHMWSKLWCTGLTRKYIMVLQSLYNDVQCCVQINRTKSEWFKVNCGLKQGCLLSPLLFNLYLNDLIKELKGQNMGITMDIDKLSIIAYADDIALLASSADELQELLNALEIWCSNNQMTVNASKSQVMHFRRLSKMKTQCLFKYGDNYLDVVSEYKYLGLYLSESLDMNFTAKNVASAANRSLGLLIAKNKALGGMPYECYTKLYDALVDSVIQYGSAVWGYRSFSTINTVQNRACRYFLGVGRYAPNVAVQGDMGWRVSEHRQWLAIARTWYRFHNMDTNRLNYRAFAWARRLALEGVKNWQFYVIQFYDKINVRLPRNDDTVVSSQAFMHDINSALETHYINIWRDKLNRTTGIRGEAGNKLRTYKLFKSDFKTEAYVKTVFTKSNRAALAKFRSGTAPIRLETGRYEHLPVAERLCPFGCGVTETEIHTLLVCPEFADIRAPVLQEASRKDPDFNNADNNNKLIVLLSDPATANFVAHMCKLILTKRRNLLYL